MGLTDKIKSFFVRENTIIQHTETQVYESFSATYDAISTISRCIDLLVNTSASIEFKIVEDIGNFDIPSTHPAFEALLNSPNKEVGRFDFFRGCYRDLIFSGNCFLYNLGDELQQLERVDYSQTSPPRIGNKILAEERLIHTRLLNDVGSRYGKSYLSRIDKELDLISKMLTFSTNYFRNNGLPGAILETENPLSSAQKNRIIEEFVNYYSISRGQNSKPFVSDSGLKFKEIQHSLKEIQFNEGIKDISSRICSGLGVNEVLLNSGNNANITMNYKMFVYSTISPLVENLCSQLTLNLHNFYRGTKKLKIIPSFDSLLLLQDDRLKQVNSIKTLVTTGLLTVNEGRQELKYQKSSSDHADELLIPVNLTGNSYEPSPGKPNEEE